MNVKDRFFALKLKWTDFKIRARNFPTGLASKIKRLNTDEIRGGWRRFLSGAVPAFARAVRGFSTDLNDWTGKTPAGKLRIVLFFIPLFLIFAIAGAFFSFCANDAFVSFRYVANAVDGFGFTYNVPPFEPVSGFTSYLWLIVLRALWAVGLRPPFSADVATGLFSMAQVAMCFLFVRRMNVQPRIRRKGLYLFLIVCLILITNRTFLAFMTSGTEAALYNFLVLWWTFEATADKKRTPLFLPVIAVLLAACRADGIVFVPATALFLLYFLFSGRGRIQCVVGFGALYGAVLYYEMLKSVYGAYVLNGFKANFYAPFPDLGREYVISFVLEYALYFWIAVFVLWAGFKFCLQRHDGKFIQLFLLIATFTAYVCFYLFVAGADSLEYRPFGFFIPLCAVAGVKMISENICGHVWSVFAWVCLYLFFALPLPWTHFLMTDGLETRRETAFLYRPVARKAGFVPFAERFDKAQKKLIYQGAALRHREHKVLTREQLKTFPTREDGARLFKRADNRLFAGHLVGVAGWTLPNAVVIDLSGQNNKVVAESPFKYHNRRLLGYEHNVSAGYVQCFNGGPGISIDPFSSRRNIAVSRVPLTDGKIAGCENFWKTQMNAPKPRSLRSKEL